jgi:hypothetical protein
LLLYLRDRVSDRKYRLYAAACAAAVEHLLESDCSREVLRLTECWADEPDWVDGRIRRATSENRRYLLTLPLHTPGQMAAEAVNQAAGVGAWAAALQVSPYVRRSLRVSRRGAVQSVAAQQAALLRHIVGNPFSPVPFDPAWRSPAALAIARAAYEDRRWDDFPFLADALEEAGCDDQALLRHCREPGEHVRGCWALDLILGRG